MDNMDDNNLVKDRLMDFHSSTAACSSTSDFHSSTAACSSTSDLHSSTTACSSTSDLHWSTTACSSTSDLNVTPRIDSDSGVDVYQEKAKHIFRILELQKTLKDLMNRINLVKEENLKLSSENQELGQYTKKLMSASTIFQPLDD